MDRVFFYKIFFVFLLGIIFPSFLVAQITAPGFDFIDKTEYPVFNEPDSIFIFCTDKDLNIAELKVETILTDEKSFNWEKYNPLTASFEAYFSEVSAAYFSGISSLSDGCYRITITKADTTEIYRAWVFNDWYEATVKISESNCDYFKLGSSFNTPTLVYNDLVDNSEIELFKDIQVEWKNGNTTIARVANPMVYNPPTEDTDYNFEVYSRFGCGTDVDITYNSIVTKAAFEVEANFNSGDQQGEAPLEVTFNNTSENGTSGQFEWFFFRDIDEIKDESENSTAPIDSFMFIAYDDNLVYSYERTGTYMVKLVSKKISEYHIQSDSMFEGMCTDTFYLEDYIVTDTSFFEAPNVFTPDGNNVNDNFIVKFWSMQDAKITIVNRWGRTVHLWKKENVRGFEGTWTESVWDGRIGGRLASPGVYYYVAEGLGRDGKERWAHGFFHLFRGKD